VNKKLVILVLVVAGLFAAPAGASTILQSACTLTQAASSASSPPQRGMATWLAWEDNEDGNINPLSNAQLTAASPVLPIPSCARVTNLVNARAVVVLIDQRSPAHSYGLLQLGNAAAEALDIHAATPIELQDLAPAATDASEPVLARVEKKNFLWSAAYANSIQAEQHLLATKRAGLAELRIAPGLINGEWSYRLRLGPLPDAISPAILAQTLRKAGLDFHTSEND
jgi:rare lipoprotein A